MRLKPKIYQIYIWQEFLKVSLVLSFVFVGFYLVIDFFEKLGDFLKFGKSFYLFLTYIFWKNWINFYEIFPFVLGLSGVLTLFFWAKTNELLGFLSLGLAKGVLLCEIGKALLFFGVLGGVVLNLVLPTATFKSLYTWEYKIVGKKKQQVVFGDQIFLAGEDCYLVAKPLEQKGEYLGEITVVVYDKDRKVSEVVWAESGHYVKGTWELKEVVRQKREKDFAPEFLSKVSYRFSFEPDTLTIVKKPIYFLSIPELIERARFLAKVNSPFEEVISELFLKGLYLLLPFLLAILPVFVFLRFYVPNDWKKGALFSVGIFFVNLMYFLFFQTLLRKGFMVGIPALAAWGIGMIIWYFWQGYLVFFKKSGKN
ncbi:LptF/LptG family permease [Thermodesulfobacterium sp. TA1]|uniref:LptF/LptG family permease n=1 Tax=Thermodesulfobacterium sp. TA1 TaxID=2234087 RepID=UPI0012323770|nr:LptF/LptG family permease [Thermodesulfobacterium sp. TA1]QER42421.1 LptF/LptG family permease [Thermodesulfobacterium sp. TA1]